MPPNPSRVETYQPSPAGSRVVAGIVAAGGVVLLVWGHGGGERIVGAVVLFLAIARWLGVAKRAVHQTEEFLVMRGALFSRRLTWAEVVSARVVRRGLAYFGLEVTAADRRRYRPDAVGYVGLRRREDHSVEPLAASIDARATGTLPFH